MSHFSSRWVLAIFLAATFSVLEIVPAVEAQTGRARRNAGAQAGSGAGAVHPGSRGNRNGMANQNNVAVARSLHSTLRLLAQADHDYQRHRALAMKHVETAIRHLVPAAARRGQLNQAGSSVSGGTAASGNGAAAGGAGNGAAAGGTGNSAVAGGARTNRMPQATSDQHLQQALQSLTAIHSQIMSGGTTQNHARAATAIQNAVRELNLALDIR
jgi:hypothetical protein